MFTEKFKDIFSRNSVETNKANKIVTLLLLLYVMLMTLEPIYKMIDFAGLEPTKTITTVVKQKEFTQTQKTGRAGFGGKVAISRTYKYTEEVYKIWFMMDGESVSMPVSKTYFDSVESGQEIQVDYGYGRLSDSRRIIELGRVAK